MSNELSIQKTGKELSSFQKIVGSLLSPFRNVVAPVPDFIDPDSNVTKEEQIKIFEMFDETFRNVLKRAINSRKNAGFENPLREDSGMLYSTARDVAESGLTGEEFVEKFRNYNPSIEKSEALADIFKKNNREYGFIKSLEVCGVDRTLETLKKTIDVIGQDINKGTNKPEPGEEGRVCPPLVLYKGTDLEQVCEAPDRINHIFAGWVALCELSEIVESSIDYDLQRKVLNEVGLQLYDARFEQNPEIWDENASPQTLDDDDRFDIEVGRFDEGRIYHFLPPEEKELLDLASVWLEERLKPDCDPDNPVALMEERNDLFLTHDSMSS